MPSAQTIYIASRTQPAAIFSAEFDGGTGRLGELQRVSEVESGFMAVHPSLPIFYAATREVARGSECNGGVRAFRFAPSGEIVPCGQISTEDNGATHIAVAPDGGCLLVCHYGGAGTTSISLSLEGELCETASMIPHEGSSAHPERQTRPHPHGIAFAQDSRFALVADLGNDHIEVFAVAADGQLTRHSRWQAAAGAGPRHLAFHPNGHWLYSINELNSTVDVLDYDCDAGELRLIQTISTLPTDFEGESHPAEICVHPNGGFVYGSNRGHNSTVVFRVESSSGELQTVQFEPTGGDHPRFVGLDVSGDAFLATNMTTGNIISFHVDATTGKLSRTGFETPIGQPMCVIFVPRS